MASEPADPPPLAPGLSELAGLLGVWRGTGHGDYPTIDAFDYVEEVEIGHVGKPFLSYRQATKDAASGLPLHAESGYFRPGGPGLVELVVAQPSGIIEIDEGSIRRDGDSVAIELRSRTVAVTSTAKSVTEVERLLDLRGNTLRYVVNMAAVGQPLQQHLVAELHRTTRPKLQG